MTARVGGWTVTTRGGRVHLVDHDPGADTDLHLAAARQLAVALATAADRADQQQPPPGPASHQEQS